jgi:hypothetical protein
LKLFNIIPQYLFTVEISVQNTIANLVVHRKYNNFLGNTYYMLNKMGKGQNVKNQNVESPKRTLKVQKEHQKSEHRKSFLDF